MTGSHNPQDEGGCTPEEMACSLEAAAMQKRGEMLARLADAALIGSKRLDGELELQFTASAETRRSLEHVIELERDCCSFLQLSIDPDEKSGNILTVHVRTSGGQDLLDGLHLLATQRAASRGDASALSVG